MYIHNSIKITTQFKGCGCQKEVTWLQSKFLTLTTAQSQGFLVACHLHKNFYWQFPQIEQKALFSLSQWCKFSVNRRLTVQSIDYTANFKFQNWNSVQPLPRQEETRRHRRFCMKPQILIQRYCWVQKNTVVSRRWYSKVNAFCCTA